MILGRKPLVLRQRCIVVMVLIAAITLIGGNAEILAVDEGSLSQHELKEAQNLFARLGYFSGSVDGTVNEWALYAALAFQRSSGLPATGRLTKSDLITLRSASPPQPKTKGFSHVEVDTSHQILFIVNPDNSVSHILPIATGSMKRFRLGRKEYRARTPLGQFTIERKIDGWRQSPLGLMYYPSYIKNGFAIHGSPEFPRRALTHGCIVVPLFAAELLSRDTPVGTIVIVY
jgi:peptidoglycan hydrolase-like protein with peptidoglycan-binding domain